MTRSYYEAISALDEFELLMLDRQIKPTQTRQQLLARLRNELERMADLEDKLKRASTRSAAKNRSE